MPKNTVPAAGEAMPTDEILKADRKTVDLNDIQSDVTHLYHLLDAATDALMELPFERDGERDGERDVPLDRVAALYWIARDMAEKLCRDIDDNFKSIEKGR